MQHEPEREDIDLHVVGLCTQWMDGRIVRAERVGRLAMGALLARTVEDGMQQTQHDMNIDGTNQRKNNRWMDEATPHKLLEGPASFS